MQIVRFKRPAGAPAVGALVGSVVHDLTARDPLGFASVTGAIAAARARGITLGVLAANSLKRSGPTYDKVDLLAPVEAPEVWAAGVTYERSRVARNEESKGHGSVYDLVYEATRPEIFFKGNPRHYVGPGDPIGIRTDSHWNVPEPELALVLGRDGAIVGYTIGNDVSSRDIEGENPLYLPQAKVYNRCASFGPSIMPADAKLDPYNLRIQCRIFRDGRPFWDGETATRQLRRKFPELVSYLFRSNHIEDGTVLMTGTALVPPASFTLEAGDMVEIEIDHIGILRNPVVRV
jgi:2-dehydro-3-deoxy-D-arabinonate dehydratase